MDAKQHFKTAQQKAEANKAPDCVKQLDTKSYWLNNVDVVENFVSLFIVDYIPYDTQQIGIWEPTNQPILIREEIDGHLFSRYALIRILTFKEVQNYAKKSCDVVSVYARHFFEITENNWRELFHKAIGPEEREQKRAQKWRYSYMAGKDINYNVHKTRRGEIIDLMRDLLKDKKYDIIRSKNEMTIVKHNDDPYNRFNEFIATPDGIYNYVEVQMGGYDKKKRVSCQDFETACFLMLAFFIVQENLTDQLISRSFVKDYLASMLNKSSDFWNGQFILDKVESFAE